MFFRILGAIFAIAGSLALDPAETGQGRDDSNPSDAPAAAAPFDPLQLNIRLSPGTLHPPADLVKQRWTLNGYRLGRLGPQAPRAAIIEDDARTRLLILSATDDGTVVVYRMGDLPVDVAARLRQTLACVNTRQCQNQRMDPAGELGCLALCLLEHLRE